MTPHTSTTRSIQSRLKRATAWQALAVALPLSVFTLACGAASNPKDDLGSTDTGNPPVIAEQKLSVEVSDSGVVVRGESGSVSAGAEVTVTNNSTEASASTTADAGGAFEVAVEGSAEDEYSLAVSHAGRTSTLDVSVQVSPTLSLEDRRFLLQSAQGYTLVQDTMLYVGFADGEVSFSAGCNGHGGSYTLCDGKLCVDSLSSTEIGCDEARHAQDVFFADFFTARPSLELSGDELTLSTEEVTLQLLDEEVANPDRPLAGPIWSIDTFIRGGAASSSPSATVPTIEFKTDGSFAVLSTCNTGGGNYEVNGDVLVLSGIGFTEEGCSEPGDSQVESHIQEVLQAGEVSFSIDQQRLDLMRGDVGLSARTD